MAAAHHALPDLDTLDPNELKALIFSHEQLFERRAIASRDNEIEHLKLLIAKLRRHAVRAQVGEAGSRDRATGVAAGRAGSHASREGSSLRKHPLLRSSAVNAAAKPARRPLPEHLPRETRKYPPKQSACPDCGGELKHLGEDVSEMLEYVPARFKVIRQVRPKLACACCERIVQAEAPSRPIERGMAGPGLLAHVLVSKYCDHLPLYRQSEIYAREGVELERSTLADWVGGTSALLAPLVEALRRHVMSASEAARRRHAGSGAGAGQRQNKNRAAVDLCAR